VACAAVAAVFLLFGIAGFIPGVTRDLHAIAWAGAGSQAYLLGVFQVSVLYNALNLAFGVAGALYALLPRAARLYLFWGAALQVVVWVFGLYGSDQPGANLLPTNEPDVWLHLVFAVVMLLLGLFVGRDRSRSSVGSSPAS